MREPAETTLRVYGPERDMFNSLRGDQPQFKFLLGLLLTADQEQIDEAKVKSMTYTYEGIVSEVARKHDLVDDVSDYEGIETLVAADGGQMLETED